MKRTRLLLFLGCLASVLLAGYGTLWLTNSKHRITEENIRAVKIGMTEKEVEELLGVPAGVYAPGAATGLYPFPMSCLVTPGLDMARSGRWKPGKEWVAKDVSIFCRLRSGRPSCSNLQRADRRWN